MNKDLRSLIPSLKNKFYFNYGGQGPLPKPSLDEIVKSWENIQALGPFTNNIWAYINKEIIKTKEVLSESLGVKKKNIALTENITTGMVLPLWGIKLEENDELLISDCEHPGIVAASREFCKRNSLKFNILPIQNINKLNDEKLVLELSKHTNKNTKIVIISHILWNFGYEIPLKRISYELKKVRNDIFLMIDGAQSFGHIDISEKVKYSDLYAITSHKWACGPEGLGAIFISNNFMKDTDPTIIGWRSLKKEQGIYASYENNFHEDARKFEIATSCIPLLAGFRKSISLLSADIYGDKKEKLITSLSNKLFSELNEIPKINLVLNPPLSNGIVSFNIDDVSDKNNLLKLLERQNIYIRLIEDPKWFRACIHQLTTEEEIDQLIKGIKKIIF